MVIDATFFGKRSDKFGLIVAKDTICNQPVWYRFIHTETIKEYALMKTQLLSEGFCIKAVTMNGKRGLYRLFHDIPIQMCHFHQHAIITRYLTRKPKMQASIELKRITFYLGKVSACRFHYLLLAWYQRHEVFINEKVSDDSKRGWHYKHKRLRAAYRSLQSHFKYLFSYQYYADLHIPTTTNALDGGLFSSMIILFKRK